MAAGTEHSVAAATHEAKQPLDISHPPAGVLVVDNFLDEAEISDALTQLDRLEKERGDQQTTCPAKRSASTVSTIGVVSSAVPPTEPGEGEVSEGVRAVKAERAGAGPHGQAGASTNISLSARCKTHCTPTGKLTYGHFFRQYTVDPS